MSKKANPKVIGAFVVGAIGLVVAAVLIFGSGRFFTRILKYVVIFESSTKGLNVGAPVRLKGVKVGSVSDITALVDTRTGEILIKVVIEIETGVVEKVGGETRLARLSAQEAIQFLIEERGMRAQLSPQSLLTGLLFVDLTFNPDTPIKLAGTNERYPEIPSIPSKLDELLKTIEDLPVDEIVQEALNTLKSIRNIVNSLETEETISTLNQTFKDIQHLVKNVDAQVAPLASSLEETLSSVQKIVRNADGKIEPLVDNIEGTAQAARDALVQIQETLANIESMTGEDSPIQYELSTAFKELSAAARAVRTLVNYLERQPDALLRGKAKPGGK
jgi:paraquat-inducible protein B